MKALRNGIALAAIMALVNFSSGLEALNFTNDAGGYGYTEIREYTFRSPFITLGTLAAVGVVAAFLLQSNGHHHGHSHAH